MEKELIKIISTLNKHKVKHLLIGGYAVILYGVQRATFDIDIGIATDRNSIEKVIFLLQKIGFKKVSPKDSGIYPTYGIRLYNNRAKLDLMFIDKPIFDNLYSYHETKKYKGITIKLPNIMDLVSLKESSNREKDLQDAMILRNIASLRGVNKKYAIR